MYQDLYPRERYPNGHPALATSLNNLGSVLLAQGEYGKALVQFTLALKMEVDLARELAATSSEATALNHAAAQPLTRDALLSVSREADPAPVYALVWQSKASLSRVFERRQLALRAAAADPKTRSAFDKLAELRRQKAGLILAPQEGKRHQKSIRQLERDLEEAEKALLPLLPALPRAEALDRSSPDDLRKALPAGAVLVDLLRYTLFEYDPRIKGKKGEKRTPCYVAFVLSREGVQRVELGQAKDLEESLTLWRQAISESTPAADASGKYAAGLRPLWDKVDRVLPSGTTTVFLSPDAALCRLPWAALPGRTKGSVLLEDHALALVPHGVFLLDRLTAQKEKGTSAPGLLLALGGVAFDDAPAEAKAEALLADLSRAGVVGAGKATWKALPGAAKEVQRLRELAGDRLKVRTLTGKEAGIEQVRTLLPQARLAHFATHGFFADPSFRSALQIDENLFAHRTFVKGGTAERIGAGARSPLVLSGLVLAGANRAETPERGILSADSVVSLPLEKLELAVLSACESGLGESAGGEGVFGLQRAFHLAGTANVVASLWKVDDEATAALMTLFYTNLWQHKLPPLEALRRAQLALYYNPGLVKEWAAGRGIDPKKVYAGPALKPPGATAPAKPTTDRTPARAWAAFSLSGLGR
jgi:CHAT domain-containing protein